MRHLIESTDTRKQRALLTTTYAAGLRVSEVVRLQVREEHEAELVPADRAAEG